MVVYTALKLAVQELPHQACGIETNHVELTSSVRMIVKFYTFNAICWPQTQLGYYCLHTLSANSRSGPLHRTHVYVDYVAAMCSKAMLL